MTPSQTACEPVSPTPPAPRKSRLWVWGGGLVVLFLVVLGLLDQVARWDLWGYMAYARYVWENQSFPAADPFSYVPTITPVVFHGWLSGLAFYFFYELAGGAGLQILRHLIALGALVCLFGAAVHRGGSRWAALLTLAVVAGFWGYVFRPIRADGFTFLGFSLFLFLCEAARSREKWAWLWVCAPVMALWANLHGGYVMGLGILGVYGFSQAVTRKRFAPFAWVLGACLLATLATPFGLQLWLNVLNVASDPSSEVVEWYSWLRAVKTLPFAPYPWLFVLCVALAAPLAALYLYRDPAALVLLAGCAWQGFAHIRYMGFFVICAAVYLPYAMTRAGEDMQARKTKGRLAAGWVALLCVALLAAGIHGAVFRIRNTGAVHSPNPLALYTPSVEEYAGSGSLYPKGAVKFIRDNELTGNILPHMAWGEYLIWELFPGCKVAMDGRLETVYPQEVRDGYWSFIRARQGWDRFLNGHPHDMILTRPNRGMAGALSRMGWKAVYADEASMLLVKTSHLKK